MYVCIRTSIKPSTSVSGMIHLHLPHREQRNYSRNINKNVLPLKIAFLYLFALLKAHLQTKYKHSFAMIEPNRHYSKKCRPLVNGMVFSVGRKAKLSERGAKCREEKETREET